MEQRRGGSSLVAGNLGNVAFASGYWIHSDRIGDAGWTEIFNSDAAVYGGSNVGNAGAMLIGSKARLTSYYQQPAWSCSDETKLGESRLSTGLV